jgi:hypothetical protein
LATPPILVGEVGDYKMKIRSEADTREGFTMRMLMSLVVAQVETEASVAAVGVRIRTLAAEYGVRVPELGEVAI